MRLSIADCSARGHSDLCCRARVGLALEKQPDHGLTAALGCSDETGGPVLQGVDHAHLRGLGSGRIMGKVQVNW